MTGTNPSGGGRYRAGVAIAALASFLIVWTTIVRDDGSGMSFFMVPMTAVVGGFAARFEAAGMARTMLGVAWCRLCWASPPRPRRWLRRCRTVR